MSLRPFRTEASFEFERVARDRIAAYLNGHGFHVSQDQRKQTGSASSQTIVAVDPNGVERKMRVRLCWRRDGRNARESLYSAAQLRARLIDGDWERTVASVAARGSSEGVTHTLFVQADADGILFAAIVPNSELLQIWMAQRRVSFDLIRSGTMGRMRKNHAENGSSPTIWLYDERTPSTHAVCDVLWSWPGVVDVRSFPAIREHVWEDALDDLPSLPEDIGADEGIQIRRVASAWKRDPRVRADVRKRANGQCERTGCLETRPYPGFLDVHHILGARTSDRVWTCVALCPNCHRDAHFAEESDQINLEFLQYAARFQTSSKCP